MIEKQDICRSLSKSGSLNGFTDHAKELSKFSETATKEEVIEFYEYLRENSHRWESEWRAEFESFFTHSRDFLPEIDESSLWGDMIHDIINTGDLEKLKEFMDHIKIMDWSFNEDWSDCEIYPIEAVDEEGELPLAKAQRLKHLNIVEYLAAIIRRFRPSN